jgi:ubiquinone/menaquinone biosynthesis C-methylase UbiE
VNKTKEHLSAGYDQTAGKYDRTVGYQYLMGLWSLLPHLRVPPRPAVLDAGCGTGSNLLEAARLFGPCRLLVGVDLSPQMVAVARSKAQAAGVPAFFLVGDAERLPLPPESFDLIICSGVYHWFEDRPGAIRQFGRLLKPGGQLALTCVAAPGFQEWMAVVRQAYRRLLGPDAQPWFPRLPTPQELVADLAGAGFRIRHLSHPVQPVLITDLSGFVNHMATTAPNWLAGLSPEWAERIRQEVLRLLTTHFPGGFPCTHGSLLVAAERMT